MNAELPAFDKTLEDKAFAEALEEDGLPPLYPNQPRWAFEDGRGGAEAEAFAQRRSDAAFAHVKLLARRHRGKKQTPNEWRALLSTAGLRPSEPTSKIFTDTKTPISVDAFPQSLGLSQTRVNAPATSSFTISTPTPGSRISHQMMPLASSRCFGVRAGA